MSPQLSDLLDKREENCRVCTDFKTWTKKKAKSDPTSTSQNTTKDSTANEKSSIGTTVATGTALATGAATTLNQPKAQVECPPDSAALGRSTWTFLHTMAAYYPRQPSEQQRHDMSSLLDKFSRFYPCGHCAEHLQAEMEVDPPRVDSRHELSQWMCETHNKVNEMLGKKIFDCTKVDERWRDGPADGSCD
ncbi:Flavin-linked sulfhydryl oxidase of the mitochondrial IMS [Dispira parvispora]|uniref:Sulfhydryl oxidase n=1 Tax=Dispira parvispora TaxID=1520584 RepID=A0A9W8E550_9FUNG|nr:Flavin-linked sulfhydryl oxidase of the mitochondrial IMS [Dispira parvispora]